MSPSPPFRLRVLGPVTVRHASDPSSSSRITQPRQVALLCYLALARPRGLHSRDTLISLLWPNGDDAHGRRAVRNALHGIRQHLGHAAIVSAGDDLIGINPDVVSCDVIDLERGTFEGEDSLDSSGDLPDPLRGLHVDGAVEFDQWMSREHSRIVALLERRAAANGPNGPARIGAAWPAGAPGSLASSDIGVLCARGHYLFLRAAHGGPAEDLLRGREYFERALAIDPAYAPALAGLSNFYAVAARRGVLVPFPDAFGRAIELSERAIATGVPLGAPHVHLAVKAMYLDDDWEKAGQEFSIAIAKEPDYAEGHRFHGVWLGMSGRHAEALRAMEVAASLEPDIPHMVSSLGAARLAVGDRAGAESALRRTLELDPRHGAARERLLRLLEEDGRLDEAIAERMREPPLAGAAAFASAHEAAGAAGYRAVLEESLLAEARGIEARLIEDPRPSSANDIFSPPVVRLVTLLARLGDWKRAKAWRLHAVAARPALARWFDAVPELWKKADGGDGRVEIAVGR